MKTIYFEANTRGHANHGWLQTYFSFSFAEYFDRQRLGFGKLRVLNDDYIAPEKGFALHPHSDMEIITIPTSGSLRHHDNMGHIEVISSNDVQVMSAGTGIYHAEYNNQPDEPLKLFQIWILPDKPGRKPRYDQATFDALDRNNKFQLLVGAMNSNAPLKINQQAYISRGSLSANNTINYSLYENTNVLFIFVIDGEIKIDAQTLHRRDALGVMECSELKIEAAENSDILIIEIPE